MMNVKLLLDTQCWLWWFAQPDRLNEEAIAHIVDEANGLRPLEIKAPHTIQIATLPLHHRNPLDRMLVAQAQLEELTLITADSIFTQYSVAVLWAVRGDR